VASVSGFIVARIVLGLGEGGNFPTCIKTIATWFPVRDRALATGIFNSGSNVGAMASPLIGAMVVSLSGWQAAFYVTGAIGFIWVIYWLMTYQGPAEHPRVSPGELAYIDSDPEIAVVKVPWARLLTLVSDTMPRGAVASAVGLGGGISSLASAFSAAAVGRVLDATGNNYTIVFFVCASVYVIATVVIHFILPHSRASMETAEEALVSVG
jgi:MFS family permease